MRLVFAGTPETAIPTLAALLKSSHDVVAVVTRPDAPVGRKSIMTASPVAAFAEANGLKVVKTNKIDSLTLDALHSLQPDLGVVVAFGAMLSQEALDTPRHGWINLHFSALPQWRGAAPVQWTLISGDQYASTSVFRLVQAMDAGDVASIERVELRGDETSGEVLGDLAHRGAQQVLRVIADIASGTAQFEPQQGAVSLARKLSVDDAQLQATLTAKANFNRFRGVTPEPGAWIIDGDVRVKIHQVALTSEVLAPGEILTRGDQILWGTSTTALQLLEVQPAGKQRMAAADWARGRR